MSEQSTFELEATCYSALRTVLQYARWIKDMNKPNSAAWENADRDEAWAERELRELQKRPRS